MPEFKCLHDACDPVNTKSEQTARAALRCDDCSLYPKQCSGLGKAELRGKSAEEKIDAFFAELARTPGNKSRGGMANKIVAKYYKEIKAARLMGHSFKFIANGLVSLGVKVSMSSLSTAFKKHESTKGKGTA